MRLCKRMVVGVALFLISAFCFGFGVSAFAKTQENFVKEPTYVDGDFTVFDANGEENASVLCGGELSFIDVGDTREVTIASKTVLTAPYSVEISLYSNTDGYPDGTFVLGHGDYTIGGSGIEGGGGMIVERSAGSLQPVGIDVRVYAADGVTEVSGNFMPGVLGGWAIGQVVLYKFDVLENGWVNVYYDYAATENPLTTLRNVIKPADGGDIDVTKQGCFVYIPRVSSSESSSAAKVRTVQYISLNGEKTVFDSFDGEKWHVAGDASKAVISRGFEMKDVDNATVASNFAFTDEGLAADGDVVFDISFTSSRSHAATSPTWGIAFGLKTKNADVSASLRYQLDTYNGRVYRGGEALENTNGAAYDTGVYNTNLDLKIRLVATKDGTLTEYRGMYGAEPAVHTTYTGLDFNGYVAFYSRKGVDSAASDGVAFKNIILKGNVAVDILAVNLDKSVFEGATQDSVITLRSTVESYPKTDCAVTYSVVKGAEICSLEENVLTVCGAGEITVRATSVDNPAVYDEHTFTVRSYVFERYTLAENFTSFNEADWTKYDADGNILVDEALYFTGDSTAEEGGSARLVSNVYFIQNREEDSIFDITFTSGLLSSAKFRESAFAWGMLFGMKTQSAAAGDAGVGFLKIDFNNTYVYNGTALLEPQFATDRTSVAGDVYFETPYDITVRLVGRNDGTLEVYRGYSVYESVSTLFATYTGLDFNGYVAFTTDSSRTGNEDPYQVRFTDVILDGNAEVDGNFEIVGVKIVEDTFKDAIVSSVPLEVSVSVSARPNLVAYRGYALSLVSGNAELNGNSLVVKGAGEITLRAVSVQDETVFDEITFTAVELTVTDIVVNENLFKGLHSDSQPVQLSAAVTCNMLANKYQAVVWTVVEGGEHAEVVLNQLRILGAGKVVLKVESVYGNFSKTITFEIADADEDMNVIGENGSASGGCGASAVTGGAFGACMLAAAATALILRKKRERKRN